MNWEEEKAVIWVKKLTNWDILFEAYLLTETAGCITIVWVWYKFHGCAQVCQLGPSAPERYLDRITGVMIR